MTRLAILGAGMAGFGAAHHFHGAGVRSTLYERKPHIGGHTATYKFDNGFIFDDGPHVSFTKNERLQDLFASNIDNKYEIVDARVNNYWQGHWIKHPAQCNLHGLPEDLVVAIIEDFVAARATGDTSVHSYKDWLYKTYGKTFADTFPIEYGVKYHTTPADNMTIDWLGPRMYEATLEEVLRGALSPSTPDVHYVTHFRYPSHGGFVSYIEPFAEKTDVHLSHEVEWIDPRAKEVAFSGGEKHPYDHVVSSIPLPRLIPMIVGAPREVTEAAAKLAFTTCILVNVGIDRADVGEATWSYFYDRDIFFTRISYPHRLSPNTVPPGASSIQAEVYFSEKYRPMDRTPDDCVAPVLEGLRRCGLIRESDNVIFTYANVTEFANVIFDHDRNAALDIVHGYLDDVGVNYCGRYGEWGHQWTDESFLSGERAAEKVLSSL